MDLFTAIDKNNKSKLSLKC